MTTLTATNDDLLPPEAGHAEPQELVHPTTDGSAAGLPGASDLDADLIERAIDEINRIVVRTGLQLHLELGQYLVNTFFGGSLERSDAARAHTSFRALTSDAYQERLRVSHVTLWTAVAILRQYAALPADLRDELSFAGHRALLTVKDPEKKVELAQRAVAEQLTEKQLKEVVKESKPASKAGRPADPAVVKWAKQLRKVVGALPAGPREALEGTPPEVVMSALDAIEQDLAMLVDFAAGVRAAVDDAADAQPDPS